MKKGITYGFDKLPMAFSKDIAKKHYPTEVSVGNTVYQRKYWNYRWNCPSVNLLFLVVIISVFFIYIYIFKLSE